MSTTATGPASSAKELLARLVAFDTTSANSNLDLVAFVEAELERNPLLEREDGVATAADRIEAFLGG